MKTKMTKADLLARIDWTERDFQNADADSGNPIWVVLPTYQAVICGHAGWEVQKVENDGFFVEEIERFG